MPTAFSGVHVRAGLYFVVTSRWRGSIGVATGAPRYTSPEAHHEIAGVEDDPLHVLDGFEAIDAADELDIARAPRRVRPHRLDVLLDRQPVAGSSHDSGRWTMRVGTSMSSMLGSSPRRHQVEHAFRSDPGIEMDLQRADARREIDDHRLEQRDEIVRRQRRAQPQPRP